MKKLLFIILLSLAFVSNAHAQDRYFGRTYTSNVLPKGSFDVELWHTSRIGHQNEFFHAQDQRMEFEVGLGSNVQTAFYFNRFQKSFSNQLNDIVHTNEIGFSNEWKWRISKPLAKTGIALYGELGVKGDEIELESKLILDRWFGKNLLACNLVYEREEVVKRENGNNTFELEQTPLELDLAYMRNISPSLGIGIEIADHNRVEEGRWNNSVLFAGPTINYRGNRWFFVGSYLGQIRNLRKSAQFPYNKVLDVQERTVARIIIGFSFN